MADLKTVWTQRKKKADERLEICKSCEFFQAYINRCAQCGCFMQAKTMFPDSKCPLNKWSEYTREDLEND